MAGVGVGSAVWDGEVTDVAPAGTLELGLHGFAAVADTPLGIPVLATVGETEVAAPGGWTLALVDPVLVPPDEPGPELQGLATVLEIPEVPIGVGEATGVGVAIGAPIWPGCVAWTGVVGVFGPGVVAVFWPGVVVVFWLGVVVVVWLGVVVVLRDGDIMLAGVLVCIPAGGPVVWAAAAANVNRTANENLLRMKNLSPADCSSVGYVDRGSLDRQFKSGCEFVLLVGCVLSHKR